MCEIKSDTSSIHGGGQNLYSVFFPGGSQLTRKSLLGYSPWGCKEPDMTEAATHAPTQAASRCDPRWCVHGILEYTVEAERALALKVITAWF